jgi:hypothetical protein
MSSFDVEPDGAFGDAGECVAANGDADADADSLLTRAAARLPAAGR